MKRNVQIIFYFLMMYLGIIRLFYWLNRKKLLTLTYHNVIPDSLYDHTPHLGVSHSETVFNAQLKLIKKRFYFSKNKLPRCTITFDDGYKNQVEVAAKLLDQHKLKGIFFIAFQCLSAQEILLIDKILMWVSYVPTGCYHIFNYALQITNDNRFKIYSEIYSILMNHAELWYQIESELEKNFSFKKLRMDKKLFYLRFRPLKFEDLKILINNGHTVASHSWSHLPLRALSIEAQKNDFQLCRKYAEKYCNANIYSYPFGGVAEVSHETVKLCEATGFSSAYMNIAAPTEWNNVNKQFVLPRMSLPNEKNYLLIEAKLSGFEMFCKNLIQKMNLTRRLVLKAWSNG